jgi:hypothetical protein
MLYLYCSVTEVGTPSNKSFQMYEHYAITNKKVAKGRKKLEATHTQSWRCSVMWLRDAMLVEFWNSKFLRSFEEDDVDIRPLSLGPGPPLLTFGDD